MVFTKLHSWFYRPWQWTRHRLNLNAAPDQAAQVRIITATHERKARDSKRLRFVVDCLLLSELIERLTFTEREDVVYVSGIRVDDDRILTRIIPVDLDSASFGHANANAASCAEVMIRLVEADLPLVAMAHSHPGTSPESTRPSSVDLCYMNTLEKNGAGVVGVIVNRGGYVRFFTSRLRFNILIQGNEFQPVKGDKHVYQLVQHEVPA